jgi:hypothetical protein
MFPQKTQLYKGLIIHVIQQYNKPFLCRKLYVNRVVCYQTPQQQTHVCKQI